MHNNVGHAGMDGPVELPEAEWDRILDLNLKGVFLACKHALPVMLAAGHGVHRERVQHRSVTLERLPLRRLCRG